MKNKEQILKEIKIREKFEEKPKNYEQFRANKTIISTLKSIVGLPSNIKWHDEIKKEIEKRKYKKN